jgi:hypothetical protein
MSLKGVDPPMQAHPGGALSDGASISPERRALVDQARKRWSDELIDRSRRNNFLYFRPLKTGTLDFSSARKPSRR